MDKLLETFRHAHLHIQDPKYGDNLRNFVNRCLVKDPARPIKLGNHHPIFDRLPTDAAIVKWCTDNCLLINN